MGYCGVLWSTVGYSGVQIGLLTLLTIVNEERRREETDLKGIGTYH